MTLGMMTHSLTEWPHSFKAKKSWSLVLKAEMTNRFQMQIQGEIIPLSEQNPINAGEMLW